MMSQNPGGQQQRLPIRGGREEGPRSSPLPTSDVPPPSKQVTKFEDEYISRSQGVSPQRGTLAQRPGYGTQGRAIVLWANFFEMDFKPDVLFYSYKVSIRPEGAPKGHLRDVFEYLLQIPSVVSCGVATDWSTEIVSCGELRVGPIEIKMEGNSIGEPKIYSVRLLRNGTIDPETLLEMLRDVESRTPISEELVAVRALNILMSAHPSQDPGIDIVGRGRNKVFWMDHRKQSFDLKGGVEAARGFYSSVRLAAGRVLLNLNVNHGAFYVEGPLVNLVLEFESTFGRDRVLFNRYIKGLRVNITHLPPRISRSGEKKYRTKSILGLASPGDGMSPPGEPENPHPPQVPRLGSCANNVKFYEDSYGKYISVADYFKRTYNISLKYADRPVVNVGNHHQPVYLPLEVCIIVRGQLFGGEMATIQRQNMIRFSCRRPPQNYESITNDGLQIMGVKNSETKRLGIRVKKQMVTVPGRILNPPSLKYGTQRILPRNGAWNVVNKKFSMGASIKSWTCIWVKKVGVKDPFTPNPGNALDAFYKKLQALGLSLPPPVLPGLMIDLEEDNSNYIAEINSTFRDIMGRHQFVAVLLPTHEDRIFDHIKLIGDTKAGVLTHCFMADKFAQSNDQYLSNNAMKVNLKMGGINQALDGPRSRLLATGKTMVVGLDVSHPSTTDPETFPSIATIVASIDGRIGQWPGQIKLQKRRQESIEHLKAMMISRLELWQKMNNDQLPQNILIYRDGVSEGQYSMVLAEELPLVRAAAQSKYPSNTQPNITVLVVGKRHNVRFFPTKESDQDRTANPINGTVVDRGITRPIYWDFYLQAQAPLQGTARPAHYIVIHDEIFTKAGAEPKPADVLQELTHNICYMMGRCTRSISYSTPAFLADKFCDRARKYVRAYYAELQERPQPPPQLYSGRKKRIYLPAPPDSLVDLHDGVKDSMVYI